MSRKPTYIANWKSNKTLQEAKEYCKELKEKSLQGAQAMLAVPYPYLIPCMELLKGSDVLVGAQNLSSKPFGAFTGEVCAEMLKSIGADFTLIGHSERRTLYHETDEIVQLKIQQAFQSGLRVVLCVGETLEEREKNLTKQVLERQVTKALEGVAEKDLPSLLIAYEPVWAIGTGKSATNQMAEEAHQDIRKICETLYSAPLADRIPILYGGSVNLNNISQLIREKNIDGALIGGASLDVQSFYNILNTGNAK